MRILLLFLAITMLAFDSDEVVIIHKTIKVSGMTSIGSFNCDYSINSLQDTLFFNESSGNHFIFAIPVREFSCGNFLLNRDFKKTIKAETYPLAKVTVTNLKGKADKYTCDLEVDLAGKQLKYHQVKLIKTNRSFITSLALSFDGLELQAPTRMGGLVKVDEKLDLEIELGFQ